FGTDQLGRDVLSRVIYGSRPALWVAFLGGTLQLAIGVVVGLLCGYFGKWVDKVLLFMTDVTWCIPGTILALAVVTILGKGLTNSIIAISLVAWASYARTVRAKTLSLRNMAFVETGKAFGESNVALMFRYILPNIVPSLIVLVSLNLPGTIMSTTTLSFLGLGSQPPSPDWGLAISDGIKSITTAPWLSLYPGLALVYTTFGFNLLGEGLRDLLDPHMKSQ
ncbi:MAG: ABC transporter permease, partial [Firmicutes bacterium]|nr:ABC transporter permease [Bacillota bacterium]